MYMRWKWFLDVFFSETNILEIKHIIKNIEQKRNKKFEKGTIEEKITKDISLMKFLKNEGKTILNMNKKEIQLYKRTSPKFLSTLKMRMLVDFHPEK